MALSGIESGLALPHVRSRDPDSWLLDRRAATRPRPIGRAVTRHAEGHFTWPEWAETLGREIKAAQVRGDPDDGSTYYHHWLAALRHLVAAKGLFGEADIARRQAAWTEAYATTPHGEPVALGPEAKGQGA